MLAFILIGSAGIALLLFSMLVGEIFDLFDGVLSGTALGGGAALFGAAGYLVLANGGQPWLANLLAVLAGLLGVLVAWWLSRKVSSLEEDGSYELVGLTGTASTRITAVIGKVQLSHPREINQRLAVCASGTVIETGTAVIVTAALGDKVRVEPLDADAAN